MFSRQPADAGARTITDGARRMIAVEDCPTIIDLTDEIEFAQDDASCQEILLTKDGRAGKIYVREGGGWRSHRPS
ncbi:hypothetical protein [Hansschlegelia sp. KR7-227]|uniref:hypothetical protein n=1 Tax=Hansschlegelia sp. KR7-227 TaxID=3400914 RepID=UPI003C07DB9A